MTDQQKTREQLIEELDDLRQQVAALQEKRKRASEANDHIGPGGTMWQSLVAETPVFILILDQDCRIRFANHTDSGAMPDQIVGKLLYDFCRPEARDSVRECVQRVFQTATPEYYEDSGLRLDEQEHWYASCFGPILENGKVVAVSVVSSNVTDRKQTERALQRSEERFRKVFEEGPMGVVLLGLDTNIQHCNHRFCEMLGYSEEEIIALDLVGITHANDRERGQQLVSRLLNGKIPTYTIEKRYVHKSGTVLWGQLTASMMHDAEGKPTTVIGMIEDITERKRAEEGLRNSERTLRTLMDASPEAIVLVDTEETVLIANETAARRFDTTVDKMIGQGIHTFVPPEVAAQRVKHLQEVIRTGKGVRFEDQRSEWYFEIAMHPIFDEKGEVAAIALLGIDRTDRKRAEVALQRAHDELERRVEERTAELTEANQQLQREVEERKAVEETLLHSRDELQMIYDEMVEGCVITDIETKRFVRANSSFCRMLGYSEEELLAASLQDIHPPEEMTNDLQRFQQVSESRCSINENRPVLRKDGTIFYADITGRRVFYNGRPCVLALFRDVTERRQAQMALQESEEKYKTLVETLPDAVIMADMAGHATFVSRRFLELHRAESADEFLGKTAWDYLIPEEHEKANLYYQKTLSDGITRGIELSFFRKDGTRFPSELSSALVKDASGKAVAIINVLRDITERKRAEEALQREHRTLKHLLESSDHERQTIACEIHDGLAQQLAGAIMQLQTYFHQKETNPKLAAKAYDAGMTMLQQGHFESRRLIAGVRPLILDESGVVAAVGHLVNEQSRLKGPKIDYHNRVDFERLAPILENAIYRIVQEALTNACKHSKSERVRVSLVQEEDRVRIEIRDWGIGFNLKSVKENRYGLVGIRQRVRLLGGKCSIRSTAGKGTRITVELPVVVRE